MKPISVHVSEDTYEELKSLAARSGRPVAELIRRAMDRYVELERRARRSILDIEPHHSGRLLSEWDRSELLDEMMVREPGSRH
jgi:predicted transcriptional regulator